jgi:hypothetical protein
VSEGWAVAEAANARIVAARKWVRYIVVVCGDWGGSVEAMKGLL